MEEKIICKICGYGKNKAIQSLQAHLNHKHKLNNKEYQELFPDAQIYSKEYSYRHRQAVLDRDPAYKVILSENTKKLYKDPLWTEKHNKALKKSQNTPEAIENHRKGANRFFENRTENQINSKKEVMRKSWDNPETRNNRVVGLQRAHRSDAVRKNHSEATKNYCKNMSLKQKEIASQKLKDTWAKPEMRKKILKIALNASKFSLSPQAIKNRNEANKRPDVLEKRRRNAIKNMLNNPKVSSLNILFEKALLEYGLQPKAEQPVNYYVVDFLFPEQKVIVEVDGDFWHANPSIYKGDLRPVQKRVVAKDKREATYCKNYGWKLLRFWETGIKKDINACLKKVEEALNEFRG